MLGDLMQDFQPQQVIYVSRSASDVENLLGKLWPTGDVSPSLEAQDREVQAHQNNADGSPAAPRWPENASVEPRLVVLGEEPSTRGNDSFLPWCEHVPGDPAQVETLRAVHKLVQPCARIALVLAGDLEDSAVAAILNFLGPFLGPEGLVLASHGRFDPSRLTTEHPLTLVLNRWFERIGGRLGYDLWETPEDRNPHVYNWSVFLRKTSNRECEAHWELTPADVPTAAGKGLYEHITSIKAPAEASSQKVAEAKLASAKDSFRKP